MSVKTLDADVHNLYADPTLSANSAGLRYIPDTKPGISRTQRKDGFVYTDAKGNPVTDERTLARIKKLVIPPAWIDVWICASPNGHLQATGRDTKGRKQYIYHPEWNQSRNQTKFGRMLAFGSMLPQIRQAIEADLRSHGLSRRKITAIALNLMDQSLIRVGNRYYAQSNQSYGLTTLRDKHVKISGAEIKFEFVGKKGVAHTISIKDKRLAQLVKKCRDIPGYDLFQYYDENGDRRTLESGDINHYLKEVTQTDFSAKDFRTWGGTVRMVECLESKLHESPETDKEKLVKEAFKTVAKGLGNTPSVCSKYYVHPQVIDLFKTDKLVNFLKKHDATKPQNKYLSGTEELVIKMLKSL
ncbi:DNA topoisomerase IB [Adhaeribacter soli]|uniref:DNA topoisomerase n=1 Tax=Adhaeribacter soli TaxID=2607655 RepID=A0A5N1IS40_9BACT|nr:DNA topoisomerase IB [Adhaeribacter soli]KAA9332864.1 DNA topoisomerase IB [Adhaeribacter soli]